MLIDYFRFIIVSHGDGHHVVPGHALVMDSEKPFAPLSKFGSSFLNRFIFFQAFKYLIYQRCHNLVLGFVFIFSFIQAPAFDLSFSSSDWHFPYRHPWHFEWWEAETGQRVSILLFHSLKFYIYFRYDFSGVVEWFAERVDVILLMFDAHKLDISDEFR